MGWLPKDRYPQADFFCCLPACDQTGEVGLGFTVGGQLLRLRIDPALELIPEISGNRLIVSVRLMKQGADERLHACTDDAAFELTLCA